METIGKGVLGDMEREVSLEEISDGELYGTNDMIRADSGSREGCFTCYRGMGPSITLDPLDMFHPAVNLGMTQEQLLAGLLELNVVDGIILSDIQMTDRDEACSFSNSEGRCGIHPCRPGFCRLFPLGGLYEDRSLHYFLQVHGYPRESRSKVKVRKWTDIPNVKEYEGFIDDWRYFLKDLDTSLKKNGNSNIRKTVDIYVLNQLYITPYNSGEGFYPQFYRRIIKTSTFAGCSGIKTTFQKRFPDIGK